MLDREDYYLVNDPDLCTSTLKYGIHFLKHNWSWMSGRPTIITILHRYHLGSTFLPLSSLLSLFFLSPSLLFFLLLLVFFFFLLLFVFFLLSLSPSFHFFLALSSYSPSFFFVLPSLLFLSRTIFLF